MLPALAFSSPAEPFAAHWDEHECDPTDKPGVTFFRDWVMAHQGGGHGSIARPCVDRLSGHSSGRAWDWLINALVPEERARADELIAWLLAGDAEMFRRVGLRYIIWNKQRWSTIDRQWVPYDGFAADGSCPNPPCRDPHTSHVHFSFGKDGADGHTSFFREVAPAPPQPTPYVPMGGGSSYTAWSIGFVLGLSAVLTLPSWWPRLRRQLT